MTTYDPSQPRRSGRFAEKAAGADQRASAPAPGVWKRESPPLAEIPLQAYNTPIFGLVGSERDEYDVDAPYQRGSVWDEERQRDLIRSMLQRIPVGAIIRAKRGRGGSGAGKYFRVVDGKQRLEALWAFTDDRLPVPADWFPDRALDTVAADGTVVWSGLSEYGRRQFEGLTIAVIELDSAVETVEVEPGTGTAGSILQFERRDRTPDESLAYEAGVYRLINTGGIGHTAEEMAAAAAVEQSGR